MKVIYYIPVLLLLHSYLFCTDAKAQDIRNDTIYVNERSEVELVFKSRSNGTLPKGDGSFKVGSTNKSLLLSASKKDVADQPLIVIVGKTQAQFILSYKEVLPAKRLDWSNKNKWEGYVKAQKGDVSKALDKANTLLNEAKRNLSDQALWENAAATYQQLENVVEPKSKETDIVKLNLEECRKQIRNIKHRKYEIAMREGQRLFSENKFAESIKAYQEAQMNQPGDSLAKKNSNLVEQQWIKDLVNNGEEAEKKKDYVSAKTHYGTALNMKPADSALQNKFNKVKKYADPLIYKAEKKIAEDALQVYDVKEAKRACDAALSVAVTLGDRAKILNLLKEVLAIEEEIRQEEEKEAKYQGILAKAKELADAASNVGNYDLAIKEYEKALTLSPARKFPRKKIEELTKIKNGIRRK